MILGMQIYIQNRVNSSVTAPFEFEDETYEIIGSGGSSPFVSLEQILIDGGGAVVFLAICVVVWRGGKWWMRALFSGAVVTFAVITLFASLRVLLTPTSLENGLSSGDSILNALCSGGLIITILVPLYVLWYVNRAPARAFFRGYYIDENNYDPQTAA